MAVLTADGGRRPVLTATASLSVVALTVAAAAATIAAHQVESNSDGVLLCVACWASGSLLAYHQPRNAIGWVLLASAAFFALDAAASAWSAYVYVDHHRGAPLGQLAVVLEPSWAPAIALFAVSILLFPDGRVPGGRWRVGLCGLLAVALVWLGGAFGIAIYAIATHAVHVDGSGNLMMIDRPRGGNGWWGIVQDVYFPVLGLSALAWVGRQVVAFRQADAVQRLQLKWLVGGAAFSVIGGLASVVGSIASGATGAVGDSLGLSLIAFPIASGNAVSRYRLYEVDRVVSRTLAYALLTALLVGTFLGLIVLSTDVLALSGRVGVAASTLAAAALFNPLRVRVQRLVDRRFNRARYNADATVAAFTARLRDALETDAIRHELLDTVNRAVQPTHASLWIKP
ncbi:MAG: hypothetical protein ACRDLP_00490 [Solirubrobacteraceae bacterium]